jgi:hypothetical protein
MDLDRESHLRSPSFKLCGVATLNLQFPAANDSVPQQLIPFKWVLNRVIVEYE